MLVPILETTIPYIRRVEQCADFSKTVQPYLPQLYDLPQQIYAHITDLQALKHLYLSTNPLILALGFALALAPIVLIVSEANKNYSQVDRLWSILPVLYNCHYALWAHLSGIPALRLDHVMAVTVLWGARLTFNYWRKGGYQVGSEDYRWVVVRKYAGTYGMFFFNVTFISLGQSLLLFLITTPTYILLLTSHLRGNTLSTYDSIFPKLIFGLIILEFFADQQQWTYHQAKAHYHATAQPPRSARYTRAQLDRGFNTSGLWAWSRHPNFAAEQAVWVALYQWGCSESATFWNWTGAGALGYLVLFQASTWFTERISKEKYPEYGVYQKRVGKFIPHAGTEGMDVVEKVQGSGEGKVGEGKGVQSNGGGNGKGTAKAKGKARKR